MTIGRQQAKTRHSIFWILSPLLCLVSFTLAQYSFDLSCLSDTFQTVAPNGFSTFSFRLANTGSLNDVYELNCRVVESVPGWFAIFCVRGICVEPGGVLYDTLNVGQFDTTIHISVYTSSTSGREVLVLKVRSLGNPAQKDSIRVYTQVGSGITENLALNLACPTFEIYPNPAKSGVAFQIKPFYLDSKKRTKTAIRIYNATGRLVRSFSFDLCPYSGSTVVFWDGRDETRQTVPNGCYIVHLINCAKAIVSKQVLLVK